MCIRARRWAAENGTAEQDRRENVKKKIMHKKEEKGGKEGEVAIKAMVQKIKNLNLNLKIKNNLNYVRIRFR